MAYIDESGFSHESTHSHGYAKIRKSLALLNGLLLTVSLFAFMDKLFYCSTVDLIAVAESDFLAQ
ncbi:MAG: hypothetical protein QX193_08720 [Methylococcales bacterium]|nr:hypothetical protein [Methylococcales bacterium]